MTEQQTMAKTVWKKGSDHWKSKLTEDQVRDIRSRAYYFGLNVHLAKEFGVNRPTISKIRNHELWRHIKCKL